MSDVAVSLPVAFPHLTEVRRQGVLELSGCLQAVRQAIDITTAVDE